MADETVVVDNDAAFAAGVWDEKPIPTPEPTPAAAVPAPEPAPISVPEPTLVPEPTADIFDANEYVKTRFGFDTEEQAIQSLKELREKAQTPAELKFANEQSRHFYEAISEGKEDLVYKHLYDKKQLERAEKLDLTKPSDAAEIIRLTMQYKYPDLNAEEIQDYFQETYVKPDKPQQAFDDVDGSVYKADLEKWQQQCEVIDKRIIREAKMVKPELAKYKSELILPKIEGAPAAQIAPSQEDLANAEKQKQEFFQQVDKGLGTLKGYAATYKDKDVEIPVSYDITPEDKAKVKPIVESLFSDFSYLQNRWQNKDGSWNTTLMAEDIHNMENRGSIHQKFVNDSAAKMLEHVIKTKKNLNVSGPSPATKIEPKDREAKFEEAVWSNS